MNMKWQSVNSKTLTSVLTPSSAQNSASFRSLKKPALSSGRSLNFVRRIAGSVLAVGVRARFPGSAGSDRRKWPKAKGSGEEQNVGGGTEEDQRGSKGAVGEAEANGQVSCL